jgi:(S)-ureidoglycine-glyoxylate aminotransferase
MVGRIHALRPRVTAVVHADTSTGVLQPLADIGHACRETGSLFVVDTVLSIGGCEVSVDEWHIDAAVGGLQKCLGGPPGLALLTCSDALRQRMVPGQSAYLDLTRLTDEWSRRPTPGSAEFSIPMLLAAREALRLVLEEGLDARWARHANASRALRAGLEAMGLELFGDPRASVPMITLVRVPDGIDEAGVRQQLLDLHGIEIMAAFGRLRGRVWRIGTMGTNAALPSVLALLAGLEAVLATRGRRLPRGAAVDQALAISRQPL